MANEFTDNKVEIESYLAAMPDLLSPRLATLRKKIVNESASEEETQLYNQLWKQAIARAKKHRTLLRQARCIELRAKGWKWNDIAADIGYATATGAQNAYNNAIKKVTETPSKEQRLLTIARMEGVISTLTEKMVHANNSSAITALSNAITQASKHLAKVTGIEAPTRHEVDVSEAREEVARFAKFVLPFIPSDVKNEFLEKFDASFGGSDTADSAPEQGAGDAR